MAGAVSGVNKEYEGMRRAYVAFDLDETIGSFNTCQIISHFLYFYTPYPELNEALEKTGRRFIECLLEKQRTVPNFILRPSILHIMEILATQFDLGRVAKVAIYSNNSNMNMLRIAKEMIELHLRKPGFIEMIVDRNHPIRADDRALSAAGSPVPIKSASVLQQIFFGRGPVPGNAEFFFFDDLVHQNILDAIGPDHYFHVEPYSIEYPDYREIIDCFRRSFVEFIESDDDLLRKYMNEIRGKVQSGTIDTATLISSIIFIHEHFKVTTKIVKHIPDDRPIFDRLTTIFPLFSASASGASASASGASASGAGASAGGSHRKYRKTRAKKGKAKKGKSKIESRARRMRNRKTHNAL